MVALYDRGLAPSTHKNRRAQASRYVRFMILHGALPLEPSVYDALQFVSSLYTSLSSPGSIRNAISGARSWILDHQGFPAALDSSAVRRLCRGGDKQSSHMVRAAPPLTPPLLQQVVSFLSSIGPSTLMPIAALLVGYFSFIRQSNLLSPSPLVWGGQHTLRRRDIRSCPRGLRILIRSSKTITSASRAVELLVPRVVGSILCPVRAWSRASSAVPASGSAPAFITSAVRSLDTPTLTKILRWSLRMVDAPSPHDYTLRSLRRGAAQACLSLGVPLTAIKAQGTWESEAVFNYVPRRAPSAAPVALAHLFGRATGTAEVVV